MRGFNVAIVGVAGLEGQELVRILEQRNFPLETLRLYSSDRSAGRKFTFNHRTIEVQETAPDSFDGMDIILFSAGAEFSRYYAHMAADKGAVVIDNSAAFRMEPNVPLVVPEVNPEDIRWNKGIIANPNPATIQMVVTLYPLHKVNPIKRITVDTYQSVSGVGTAAIEELRLQTRQVLDGEAVIPHVFPHQIAFNVLPETDVFLDNGYSKEEWKLLEETKKILHADSLAISATCVRVPVFVGHAESINVDFTKPMSPDEAERILAQAPGVRLMDDTSISLYPQPWTVAGADDVFVGRLRQHPSNPSCLAMWVVADNVRKGAALNAVQIAEEMIKREWIKLRRRGK